MENKKDRLLLESEVIAVVDKHTNSHNGLNNDITCILEELKGIDIEVKQGKKYTSCLTIPIQPTVPPMPKIQKKDDTYSKIKDILNETYRQWTDFSEDRIDCTLLDYNNFILEIAEQMKEE